MAFFFASDRCWTVPLIHDPTPALGKKKYYPVLPLCRPYALALGWVSERIRANQNVFRLCALYKMLVPDQIYYLIRGHDSTPWAKRNTILTSPCVALTH